MYRWQYQSKAEPVSLSGENITPDKWYQSAPEVIRRSTAIALTAGAFFFVPVIAAAEVVTLDKWFSDTSQPVYTQQTTHLQSNKSEILYTSTVEEVTLDKWYRPLSTPPKAVRNTNFLYQSFCWITDSFIETTTLDKWFKEIVQPLHSKPRVGFFNYTLTDPYALTLVGAAESITVDKWFMQHPEQVFRKKIPFWQGGPWTVIPILEVSGWVHHVPFVADSWAQGVDVTSAWKPTIKLTLGWSG